eukprot:Awhi_evm1s2052
MEKIRCSDLDYLHGDNGSTINACMPVTPKPSSAINYKSMVERGVFVLEELKDDYFWPNRSLLKASGKSSYSVPPLHNYDLTESYLIIQRYMDVMKGVDTSALDLSLRSSYETCLSFHQFLRFMVSQGMIEKNVLSNPKQLFSSNNFNIKFVMAFAKNLSDSLEIPASTVYHKLCFIKKAYGILYKYYIFEQELKPTHRVQLSMDEISVCSQKYKKEGRMQSRKRNSKSRMEENNSWLTLDQIRQGESLAYSYLRNLKRRKNAHALSLKNLKIFTMAILSLLVLSLQ